MSGSAAGNDRTDEAARGTPHLLNARRFRYCEKGKNGTTRIDALSLSVIAIAIYLACNMHAFRLFLN